MVQQLILFAVTIVLLVLIPAGSAIVVLRQNKKEEAQRRRRFIQNLKKLIIDGISKLPPEEVHEALTRLRTDPDTRSLSDPQVALDQLIAEGKIVAEIHDGVEHFRLPDQPPPLSKG